MKDLGALLPLALIALLFYVLVIRPARKRQQQLASTQSSVQVGSEIMLSSGIFGTVVSLADETLVLEVSPGTRLKVARQAVMRVVEPGSPASDRQGLGTEETNGGPATTVEPSTEQD